MQQLIKSSARRFASLVPKAASSDSVAPVYNEKLTDTQSKLMPYSTDYSNVNLLKYFKENALIIPPEQIIEKANQRDYEFFLKYPNFLKVVDTLEKFSSSFNIENEDQKRNFFDFKVKLYEYYEIQSRSIREHEKYSFTIERRELSALARANQHFVQRLDIGRNKVKVLNKYMLKGKIFKAKLLNSNRIQGIFSGLTAFTIYHYLPYFTLYAGPNIPILAAVFAGLYTIGAFGESNYISEISFDGPQSEFVSITYCPTPLSTKKILAKPQNIKSGQSFKNPEGMILVKEAIDAITNKPIPETELTLSISSEAWMDYQAIDWLISNKSASYDSDKALLNHILELTENRKISQKSSDISDIQIAQELSNTSSGVTEDKIQDLIGKYGDEHLKQISDSELLDLYKSVSK